MTSLIMAARSLYGKNELKPRENKVLKISTTSIAVKLLDKRQVKVLFYNDKV